MKKNMEQANYVKAIITGILAFLSSLLKPLVKNIRSQVEHQTDILENDEEEE